METFLFVQDQNVLNDVADFDFRGKVYNDPSTTSANKGSCASYTGLSMEPLGQH